MSKKIKKVKEFLDEEGRYEIFNVENFMGVDDLPVEVLVPDYISSEDQLAANRTYFQERLDEIDDIISQIDKIKADKLAK